MQKVNFGFHYFSIALSLRQAMLINGILTNCEIWYGVTEKEILKLEEIDNIFFRKLFRVPASCPKEALYLETGSIPIGIIVKMRRVTYLHHILTRSKDEMLSNNFFMPSGTIRLKAIGRNKLRTTYVISILTMISAKLKIIVRLDSKIL